MSERHRLPRWARRWLARRWLGPIAVKTPAQRRAVCIYKVDRLGDAVLALGAIRTLVQKFGEENCRLIVSDAAEPLFAAEFPRAPRWTAPANASGIWREIRPLQRRLRAEWSAERFDLLVCLRHQRSLYRDLTVSWIRAEEKYLLDGPPSDESLALANRPELPATYPPVATLPWSRELLAHARVLSAATGRTESWSALRPQLASSTAHRGSEIVFCPFGSEAVRDYPLPHWAAAWRAAQPPEGAPILLMAAETRRAALESLAGLMRGELPTAKIAVAAPASSREFIERIARARAVVSLDSAGAHLATALDKPAVIVAGGGHFGWFGPWGDSPRQRWLAQTMDCFGCNWECRYPTVRCLEELSPATVGAALKEMIHAS
jgi:ADP-heptose:LPS heptosyltransferase